MDTKDLEYRIKLNSLRVKYSKNTMDIIYLYTDSVISLVEFSKQNRYVSEKRR